MRSTGGWTSAVLVIGIAVTLLPVGSAVADARERVDPPRALASAPEPAVGPPDRIVTLITGDRVGVVDRDGRLETVWIETGPGRTGVTFTTNRTGGRLRITPSDAVPLLTAGRLDSRLFDVSTLVEFGYDDSRPDLPLIVTDDAGEVGIRARGGALPGAADVRAVPGGTALRVGARDLSAVWRSLSGTLGPRGTGRSKVWLDGLRKPALTESVPQIGAPAAWAAGFTGVGVKVGVIDSGIDTTHPDLAGRVALAKNFLPDNDLRDLTGHGTHVAATVAGIGAGGTHRGVAPDARLVSARVCGPGDCPESAILAALQWVADQGVKVVNMSLGGPDLPGRDLVEEAVDRITAESGVLFVIAAGDFGDGPETIASPGSADSALTVGAVSKTDELAEFSSRGPRTYDGALKPDITAPGVDIVAARAAPGDGGAGGAGGRVAKSGTSMAAPHVTGAAAILAQRHPAWTPVQLKSALMGSARTDPAIGIYEQGAGRLDLTRGIQQSVLADPPSLSLQDTWPIERSPTVRTITYRNTAPQPVTLTLDLRTTAPAGMFSLSGRTVTVAAGGTADVRLTIRTAIRGAGPRNVGYLVATAGSQTVTTPFVAVVETEPTYEVNITHIDRDGGPAPHALSALVDIERDTAYEIATPTVRRRVPKGRYVLMTYFQTGPDAVISVLVEPFVTVDRDLSLTRDARSARPVSVRAPQPDAKVIYANMAVAAFTPDRMAYLIQGDAHALGRFFFGPGGPVPRNPAVQSFFSAVLAKDGVKPADSPYLVDVAWRERGRLFPGLNRTVDRADLAEVRTDYAGHALPDALMLYSATWPGAPFVITDQAPARLPSSRVEYYNTEDGLRRGMSLREGNHASGYGNSLRSPLRTFKAGTRYHERRNAGVYGPGFTAPPFLDGGTMIRRGNSVHLRPTLVNDANNWTGGLPELKRPMITLDRNGVRVVEREASFVAVEVPAAAGTYRLRADLSRPVPYTLSTRITCEWTFRSGTVPSDRWTPLPLSVVRFRPPLNRDNAGPAGRLFLVPYEVQRQPGSAAGMARKLTVEVSFDDGATWRSAHVIGFAQHGLVLVRHPPGPGFVSLRATSVDTAGNTAAETIIRAYRTA